MRILNTLPLLALLALPCSAQKPRVTGNVLSGGPSTSTSALPLKNAHVYLFAANNAGYGLASKSLLTGTGNTDGMGQQYVLTNDKGHFEIPRDLFACKPNDQLYLLATAGDAGVGANAAATLLAPVGDCIPKMKLSRWHDAVVLNEATTVATVYALSGFMTGATSLSYDGNKSLAGLGHAFAAIGNLVTVKTGAPLAMTPAGNGTVPQAKLDLLANMLLPCVRSSGSLAAGSPCQLLFSNTPSKLGVPAADTAGALRNIVSQPDKNVAALFNLIGGAPLYLPSPPTAPIDWTLSITYTAPNINSPTLLAIDSKGDIWVPEPGATNGVYSLTELSPLGVVLSGTGFTDATLNGPVAVAIDQSDNVYVANQGSYFISEFASNGASVIPAGATTPGHAAPAPGATLAIDKTGVVWLLTEDARLCSYDPRPQPATTQAWSRAPPRLWRCRRPAALTPTASPSMQRVSSGQPNTAAKRWCNTILQATEPSSPILSASTRTG